MAAYVSAKADKGKASAPLVLGHSMYQPVPQFAKLKY